MLQLIASHNSHPGGMRHLSFALGPLTPNLRSSTNVSVRDVVVVDDSPRVLDGLCRMLVRRGFTPQPYQTFSAACFALQSIDAAPAAAMFDVFLDRGKLGFDLCDLLRERFVAVPTMMISGYALGELKSPYWLPPNESHTHFESSRVPVYGKPIRTCLVDSFLVWSATMNSLRHSPHILRNAVLSFSVHHGLTPQQARVLAHLFAGSVRSSLPEDLGLSRDTVKSQVKALLAKTNATSTEQLTAHVLRSLANCVAHEPECAHADHSQQSASHCTQLRSQATQSRTLHEQY